MAVDDLEDFMKSGTFVAEMPRMYLLDLRISFDRICADFQKFVGQSPGHKTSLRFIKAPVREAHPFSTGFEWDGDVKVSVEIDVSGVKPLDRFRCRHMRFDFDRLKWAGRAAPR